MEIQAMFPLIILLISSCSIKHCICRPLNSFSGSIDESQVLKLDEPTLVEFPKSPRSPAGSAMRFPVDIGDDLPVYRPINPPTPTCPPLKPKFQNGPPIPPSPPMEWLTVNAAPVSPGGGS